MGNNKHNYTNYNYKMEDLDCKYCIDKKKKIECADRLCPHIMDNLSELFGNHAFREAVKNADDCRTPHRYTLQHLKELAVKRNYYFMREKTDENDGGNHPKPGCGKCQYNSTGFICYNKNDGSCLKDWVKEKNNAGICKPRADSAGKADRFADVPANL